jgi:hypothetical protein
VTHNAPGSGDAYKSIDGGSSFTLSSIDPNMGLAQKEIIIPYHNAYWDDSLIHAAASWDQSYYTSIDGGGSWTEATVPPAPYPHRLRCRVTDKNETYACDDAGIRKYNASTGEWDMWWTESGTLLGDWYDVLPILYNADGTMAECIVAGANTGDNAEIGLITNDGATQLDLSSDFWTVMGGVDTAVMVIAHQIDKYAL